MFRTPEYVLLFFQICTSAHFCFVLATAAAGSSPGGRWARNRGNNVRIYTPCQGERKHAGGSRQRTRDPHLRESAECARRTHHLLC